MGSREVLDMTEWLHFHFSLSCIGEGNATHSRVLAWRTPGTGEPGGLPSMGSRRVGHDWSDLAAAESISFIFLNMNFSINARFLPFCNIWCSWIFCLSLYLYFHYCLHSSSLTQKPDSTIQVSLPLWRGGSVMLYKELCINLCATTVWVTLKNFSEFRILYF